jgi:hypothetical protein
MKKIEVESGFKKFVEILENSNGNDVWEVSVEASSFPIAAYYCGLNQRFVSTKRLRFFLEEIRKYTKSIEIKDKEIVIIFEKVFHLFNNKKEREKIVLKRKGGQVYY